MNKQEQTIIDAFKYDDEKALKMLFHHYSRSLCVYAMKFTDDIQVSEDLVQDTIVKLWEDKQYRSITGSLKKYLFITVRNKAINHLKSKKNVSTVYLEHLNIEFAFDQFDDDEIAEKKKKLFQEIEKLSPQSRKVLKMIALERKKYKEVSEELDVSLNTVKTHFSRALKQLRNCMKSVIIIFITQVFTLMN